MPPVPVPEVDFREELVVVTILGWQSTMGPLTEILGISWNGDTGRLKVTVLDDTTPGMLPATSNPYHIIRVARRPFRSVDFEHEKEWTPPGFAVPAE